MCSTQLSLFQRNNMGNFCICSMQVHQSRFSPPPQSFTNHPQWFLSSCSWVYVPRFTLDSPPRSRSSPRCCSWPPFSEPGRDTCTYPHPGTGTCTRWLQRAGCCKDIKVSFTCGRQNFKEGGGSPFHEIDHVDNARRTDHWLVGEDGPHGLFHAELRLQGRQKRLNFLP